MNAATAIEYMKDAEPLATGSAAVGVRTGIARATAP
jgi:hypothetical protein